MSQENVEIVRRGYEAFNRGDIDGVVGLLAPAFEYVASGLVPGVGGRGAGGLRGFADTSWAEFNDPRMEVHELIDAAVRCEENGVPFDPSARGACCHSSPKALVRHPGLSTHGARRKTRVGPDVDWGWPRIGAAWAGVVSAPRSNYSNTQKGAPCFGLERVKQSHSQRRGG
jgi:hypothetical protein